MFALIIIAIVLCGIVAIFPNAMGMVMGEPEDKIVGAINLVPLIFAIVVLSICLARL